MATLRFKALEILFDRQAKHVTYPSVKTSDYYGANIFDKEKMQKYMPREAYLSVIESIEQGTRIDRKIANQVAAGMKAWATEKGATHYTHWFHPLTDASAEKHDAFFDIEPGTGKSFESFDGALLVQQEPDASSLPNGGLRNTFEARGYSAWDPSSPAFVVDNTLCIPTIFVAYTGESLDYKLPLMKSLNYLDRAATEVCGFFDKNVTKVIATLGWEQEYFLIDDALYQARPDLQLTGRTLMGHASAKDQQLSDHYFGSIPERVAAYMHDFEIEAHKLGIPVKTRHNEVAPNQFECAPIFEEMNLAVDHNQLLMDIMNKVARRHNFRVLFHEKPFKGINGSGKHCNWSMATNTGVNLLRPGKNPKTNLQFLTFLVNIVKAVHDNADLLRSGIVSAGNEHRLGAHEAPPAIISAFIGTELTKILNEIVERVSDKKMSATAKTDLKLDIGRIPEILLDNTDRNRTSPFAFTGNRFEFRAVGSSANTATAMIILNTAVARQLDEFKTTIEALVEKGVKKDEAIFQTLREYIIVSEKIRFEGNGYSQDWVEEAARRGLSNVRTVPDAMKAFVSKEAIKLFNEAGVYTEPEIMARYEVILEKYTKKIQIESRVLADLSINHIVPTAVKYQTELINNVRGLKEIVSAEDFELLAGARIENIKVIANHISQIKTKVNEMIEARKDANNMEDGAVMADAYDKKVKPFMSQIRYHIDKLELIVDNEMWPLPKYRELLFAR